MCEAVSFLSKSTGQLISMGDEEIKEALHRISSAWVSYKSWERVSKPYNGKTITHTKLVDVKRTTGDFIASFMATMPTFRAHCAKVGAQYDALHALENKLPRDHMIVQMDYSENWNCAYLKEITSAYYSKDQITIHPMVTKRRNEEGELVVSSYAGVPSVTSESHTPTSRLCTS